MIDLKTRQAIQTTYPLLQKASSPVIEILSQQAQSLSIAAKSQVFKPGALCPGMVLVLKGSIKVSKLSENGRQIVLYRVGPGETCVVTSSCLLRHANYDAFGETEMDTDIVLIPADTFKQLVNESAPVRDMVFGTFVQRLEELMWLVDAVAFHKLDERLAKWLVARPSPITVTHQTIADELGSVRELITKVLRQFVDEGLVELGRERITVQNLIALKQRAGLV